MTETKGERIFIRSVLIVVGIGSLAMCVVGAVNEHLLQTKGVKTTGKVLELKLDRHYRTTNYRRNEDFYRVPLEFLDQGGQKRTIEAQASTQEIKTFGVIVGSLQPIVYIPGNERCRFDFQVSRMKEMIVWFVVFLTLGLFLISWGIWGKIPSAK